MIASAPLGPTQCAGRRRVVDLDERPGPTIDRLRHARERRCAAPSSRKSGTRSTSVGAGDHAVDRRVQFDLHRLRDVVVRLLLKRLHCKSPTTNVRGLLTPSFLHNANVVVARWHIGGDGDLELVRTAAAPFGGGGGIFLLRVLGIEFRLGRRNNLLRLDAGMIEEQCLRCRPGRRRKGQLGDGRSGLCTGRLYRVQSGQRQAGLLLRDRRNAANSTRMVQSRNRVMGPLRRIDKSELGAGERKRVRGVGSTVAILMDCIRRVKSVVQSQSTSGNGNSIRPFRLFHFMDDKSPGTKHDGLIPWIHLIAPFRKPFRQRICICRYVHFMQISDRHQIADDESRRRRERFLANLLALRLELHRRDDVRIANARLDARAARRADASNRASKSTRDRADSASPKTARRVRGRSNSAHSGFAGKTSIDP